MVSAIPDDPLEETRSRSASSTVLDYGLAIAAFAAAILLTFFIRYITGNPTFFAFYVAIFLSVWFGGRGPGWLSALLALAALPWLFRSSGELLVLTGERLPTVLAFVVCAITADVLSTRRHRAESALRLARDRLELAVEKRTAELRQVNEALSEEITVDPEELAEAEKLLRQAEAKAGYK